METLERAPDCLEAATETWLRPFARDATDEREAACEQLAVFGVLSNRHLEAITGLSETRVAAITQKKDHTGGRLAVHTLPLILRLRVDYDAGLRNHRLLDTIVKQGTSRGMVAKLTGIPPKVVERMGS